MKALVTGATGFIGSHVVRALSAKGWSVRAGARESSPRHVLADVDPEWVPADVTDEESLSKAMEGCDAVFHVAAHYSLWAKDDAVFEAVNVQGTRNVLQAAKAAGVKRVVHTSSVACVGEGPAGGVANEDTQVVLANVCGGYERSKVAAEAVVQEAVAAGQDVVIVNPASTIGPGDVKPTPTGKIITDFLDGKMPFYMDTGLNFVDVRDVAEAHVLAFEKGSSGRRYILGNKDGNKTLREFLEVVGKVAGRRAPRFRIPYSIAWMAGKTSTMIADYVTKKEPAVPLTGVQIAKHRMFFDPSRAVEELGMPQRKLEDTVRDAVAWFREQNGAG